MHAQNNNIFALEKKKNINFKQKNMKTLKQMGLVSLTQKENQNTNGGTIKVVKNIEIIDKWCCYNIPPIEFPIPVPTVNKII